MLIPVEKHQSHGVVELVHSVEVRNLGNINNVHYDVVSKKRCCFNQHLVHFHTLRVPVMAKTDYYELLGLVNDCLVHLPAVIKVRKQIGHLLQNCYNFNNLQFDLCFCYLSQFINLFEPKILMLAKTIDKLRRNSSNTSYQHASHRASVNQKQRSLVHRLQNSPQAIKLKTYQSTNNLHYSAPTSGKSQLGSGFYNPNNRFIQIPRLAIPNKNERIDNKAQTPRDTKQCKEEQQTIIKAIVENDQQISTNDSKKYNLSEQVPIISPFEAGSKTDRVQISQNNRLAFPNTQQIIEIDTLKLKISSIFSQKLELELKLSRAQKQNMIIQNQNITLKKEIEQLKSTQHPSISPDVSHQNEYIVQLLEQYQSTKQIIETLINDNKLLSKKNDQLKQSITVLSQSKELQKLTVTQQKQQISQINQNLQSQISRLQTQKQISSLQIIYLKQQLDQTKNIYSQTSQTRELQQLKGILTQKQKQLQNSRLQLIQMNSKMKEVLFQLSHFSQVYEAEKAALRKEYEEYKLNSTKQILHYRSLIPNITPKPNIFIEDRDEALNNLFVDEAQYINPKH